jgi:hypothetical protein
MRRADLKAEGKHIIRPFIQKAIGNPHLEIIIVGILAGFTFILFILWLWLVLPTISIEGNGSISHLDSGSAAKTKSTHIEPSKRSKIIEGLDALTAHIFAVFLELLVAFILVELIWKKHEHSREKREMVREKQKEIDKKEEQLRFIKSYMFHARMRTLFITNFLALKTPPVSFAEIGTTQAIPELNQIHYETQTAKIAVIQEYVKAEDVWQRFLDLGIMFSIDRIVKDMTCILQRVEEVKEIFPSRSITNMPAHEFAAQLVKDHNGDLIDQFEPIIKAGIVKFYEYARDLRDSNKELFNNLIDFYSRAYNREQAQQAERRRVEQLTVVVHSSLTVETATMKQSDDMN